MKSSRLRDQDEKNTNLDFKGLFVGGGMDINMKIFSVTSC
jgi:hypothetical protein